MELLFLGTGSGVPAKHRNTSSVALKMLNERNEVWLFDCGEATQHQILKTTLKPRKISKIFITHLHGDHIYGLPGFLSSRAFQGGDEALTVYGPKGIKDFIVTSLKVTQTHLRYPLHFVEMTEDEGKLFEDNDVIVMYSLLSHGVPSYGFRVEEKSKPGTLLVDKLKEERIPPGPLYGRLKNGETVTLEDGRVVEGNNYIGPPIKGKVVTLLGDTKPVSSAAPLAKDADVLIHESTFAHEDHVLANNYNHSTNVQAAELAKKAGVKRLLLTHISSRYLGRDVHALEKHAKKVFPNTQIMHDLQEVEI